jgi:hypothetical protein
MMEKFGQEQEVLAQEYADLKEKRRQQEIDGKISPLLVNLKEQLDLDRRNQEVMDELKEISDAYSEKMLIKLAEAEN